MGSFSFCQSRACYAWRRFRPRIIAKNFEKRPLRQDRPVRRGDCSNGLYHPGTMRVKKTRTGASSPSRFSKALAPDVRPREVWAWAMYDFANSGYTTVVITAVFNA